MAPNAFEKVAFVGIGNMGWPMAARLVGAGYPVTVFDVSPERATQFASEYGASGAVTLEEAAAGASVIITMLPTSKHVSEVVETVSHLLADGALLIDMTSGKPTMTKALCASLEKQGRAMIDAAVSGGVARAKTGELAIMTGGAPEAKTRAKPLLDAMGTSVIDVGSIGAGQAMKALNNLVSAGGFLIGVEALLIGQQFGLDPGKMVDVLNVSTGMNNSTQKKFRQFVLARTFNSNFGLDLMAKDLGIALEVASEGGVATPFAQLCQALWQDAAKDLGPGKDHTEMAKHSEKLAGFLLQQDGNA